ncbi:MAG: GAF domain-containing protein, partial [bacterium]
MEVKCLEKILKSLDNLIVEVIEKQDIINITFNEFLDKCFSIVKQCQLFEEIYFSQDFVDEKEKVVLELSLRNESIGYLVLKLKEKNDWVDIFIFNLKQVIFAFLSFRDLYSTLSELKYLEVKFEAYRKAFYDISRAILSSLSEEVILKIICQISQELVLSSACVIFFKNKFVYTASNRLIEQELNFAIPEIRNLINKKVGLFYGDVEFINIDNPYIKHLKAAFFKKFNVPLGGPGVFVLLFTRESELSKIDMDFIYTVTSSIATALETRRLFEQLALKNSFLEKLFVSSAKLSEVNSFEELYQALYGIVNEMFAGCDFVVFRAFKGEVFKPVYIRIANAK